MASTDLVIAFDARIGNLETALNRTQAALRATESSAKSTSTAVQGLEPATASAARGVEALNSSLGKTSSALTAFSSAARFLGLEGVASGLDIAVTSVNGVTAAVTSAGAAAESAGGLFSGALSRIAGIAGPIAATVVLLQSLGLGIRSAGEATQTGSQAATNYSTALANLTNFMNSNAVAAQTNANAIAALNEQLRQNRVQGELAMGGQFEIRSQALLEVARIDEQLARMEQRYNAARESSRQGGRGIDEMRNIENERVTLAERRAAAVAREAAATARIEELRNAPNMAPGQDPATLPRVVSTVPFGPELPPTTTRTPAGGGAARQLDELAQAAQRLYESTRTPLENFSANMAKALEVFSAGKLTGSLGGLDTVQRAVVDYAQNTYRALTAAGASAEEAQNQVNEALLRQGESLRASGVTWEQWQTIVRAANDRVRESSQTTDQAMDKSVKSASSSISNAFSGMIVSVSTGTATVEDAWKKMLSTILSTVIEFVYQMTLQAAILRALKAIFTSFGGVTSGTGGGVSTQSIDQTRSAGFGSTGAPDAGISTFARDATLGGVSTFASGNGPIAGGVSVDPASSDVTVNIYNNSDARVRSEERTDSMGNKMIEVFVENLVKNGLAAGRYDGVMQTSFGASRIGRV